MNVIRTAIVTTLVLGITACSSPKVVRVPAPLEPIDSPLQINHNWQVKLHAMPVFDGEGLNIAHNETAVFTADQKGMVAAFKIENQSRWTDQVLWQSQLSEKVLSGPALDGRYVIVGTSKGKVVAFDQASGEVLWQTQLSSEVVSKAAIADNKVFTRTVDGHLYALSLSSGKVIWVNERQMPSLSLRGSSPVLYNEGILYVGWETGKVEAIKADSGKSLWESDVAIPRGRTDLERMVDIQASLMIRDNRLVALGYQGKLAAMSLETGYLFYAEDLSGYRDFVVDEKAIYAIDEDDYINAYDVSNGTKLWVNKTLQNRSLGDLKTHQNSLLAIDGLGYIHWLDKLHGTVEARVKHSNDYGDENTVLQALVNGDDIYLLDQQGTLNSYHIEKSDLAKFKAQHQMVKQDKKVNHE
ncbi:MAG: outer membrane protein assembly factor BamB [Thiotrichales bacterium]|nr:outer membrane protein assembly factor BamB [Thiotrichales bacterium]